MPQALLLYLPLGWFALRLLLVVPRGLRAARVPNPSPSPFSPSGEVGQKDSGCLLGLISGVFGAALGVSLPLLAPGMDRIAAVLLGVALGVIGFVLGAGLDMWLTDRAEAQVARRPLLGRLPEVRKWLTAGSDEEQMRAAIVLGQLRKQPEALQYFPELLAVLRSPNPQVRYLAACAVMALVQETHAGPPGMEAAVRPLLADPEVKVRAPAARALVAARLARLSEVIHPLASALWSDDSTAWGLVTWYLDAPGRSTHLILPEIFAAVARHDRRLGALELVFRWIDPAGKPALTQGLSHPNAHVRRLAEHGLARMRGG